MFPHLAKNTAGSFYENIIIRNYKAAGIIAKPNMYKSFPGNKSPEQ